MSDSEEEVGTYYKFASQEFLQRMEMEPRSVVSNECESGATVSDEEFDMFFKYLSEKWLCEDLSPKIEMERKSCSVLLDDYDWDGTDQEAQAFVNYQKEFDELEKLDEKTLTSEELEKRLEVYQNLKKQLEEIQ